jgi:hypothetical protein
MAAIEQAIKAAAVCPLRAEQADEKGKTNG